MSVSAMGEVLPATSGNQWESNRMCITLYITNKHIHHLFSGCLPPLSARHWVKNGWSTGSIAEYQRSPSGADQPKLTEFVSKISGYPIEAYVCLSVCIYLYFYHLYIYISYIYICYYNLKYNYNINTYVYIYINTTSPHVHGCSSRSISHHAQNLVEHGSCSSPGSALAAHSYPWERRTKK